MSSSALLPPTRYARARTNPRTNANPSENANANQTKTTTHNHRAKSSFSATPMITPPSSSSSAAATAAAATAAAAENDYDSLQKRMSVNKHVIDELLLVCSVIGTSVESRNAPISSNSSSNLSSNTHSHTKTVSNMIVPVTDGLNWLQDLQRALRRDDDAYRPISLLLGKWKVVPQKLLPLALGCRYDTPMILTICKILVILTKPLAPGTVRAAKMVICPKKKGVPEGFIKEQIKIRNNALEQAQLLLDYKQAICQSSARHHRARNRQSGNTSSSSSNSGTLSSSGGILSIFVSLLAEPLSKSGSARTDQDHLTMELVLHLLRNLLTAGQGSQLLFGTSCPQRKAQARALHADFICLLQDEMVLDILLVLAADLEQRENAPYNLLLLEILSALVGSADPRTVVQSSLSLSSSSLAIPVAATATARTSQTGSSSRTRSSRTVSSSVSTAPPTATTSLLSRQLASEKQQLHRTAGSRHSQFAGTLVQATRRGTTGGGGAGPHRSYQSAGAFFGNCRGEPSAGAAAAKRRRTTKTSDPFVGGAAASAAVAQLQGGPRQRRAHKVLHEFCRRFVGTHDTTPANKNARNMGEQADSNPAVSGGGGGCCYATVMKSLKNEFRRDSQRLEEGDLVVFFRLVWFFGQWWRLTREQEHTQAPTQDPSQVASVAETTTDITTTTLDTTESTTDRNNNNKAAVLGQLIFTMDVFTFNLVLNAIDTFLAHKKYTALAQTVALLAELMHQLYAMSTSQESTEHLMSMGLMDRLFYGGNHNDPLDRLPKLLAKWAPGIFTREYLCDLVEVCHMTLQLLEHNQDAMERLVLEKDPYYYQNINKKGSKKDPKKKNTSNNSNSNHTKLDTVAKMAATAVDFDVTSYFCRKLVSHHTVYLYTQLLSQYASNRPLVNQRLMAFLERLGQLTIAEAADMDTGDADMDTTDPMHDKDPDAPRNLLAPRRVTLQPMLWNLPFLTVLETILNDPGLLPSFVPTGTSITSTSSTIKDDSSRLLVFATQHMHAFATAAAENPLWFVEALLSKPTGSNVQPGRFCELTTNLYVSEELRMIAEREWLLHEEARLEECCVAYSSSTGTDTGNGRSDKENNDRLPAAERKGHAAATKIRREGLSRAGNRKDIYDDDDDDDEVEFEDFGITTTAGATSRTNDDHSTQKTTKTTNKRKRPFSSASDEDDDKDDDDVSETIPAVAVAAATTNTTHDDRDEQSEDELASKRKQELVEERGTRLCAQNMKGVMMNEDDKDETQEKRPNLDPTTTITTTTAAFGQNRNAGNESSDEEGTWWDGRSAPASKKAAGHGVLEDSDDEDRRGGNENRSRVYNDII